MKKNKHRRLTPVQTHDVWDVPVVDEITEEMEKALKSLGMNTDEVDKATLTPTPKEKENGGTS